MKIKSTITVLFLSLFLVGTLFTACSDDGAANVENTPGAVNTLMKNGTWKITSYVDSDVDKTANFDGFVFTFEENNILRAKKEMETYTGTWSVSNSDGNDGSEELDFNVLFANPTTFSEITDDWDIFSKNDTTLELIDESNGSGGTDYLTFTKIQ